MGPEVKRRVAAGAAVAVVLVAGAVAWKATHTDKHRYCATWEATSGEPAGSRLPKLKEVAPEDQRALYDALWAAPPQSQIPTIEVQIDLIRNLQSTSAALNRYAEVECGLEGDLE